MTMSELYDFERDDENEPKRECGTCEGLGGWDKSSDCETYDNWEDCPECEGTGVIEND